MLLNLEGLDGAGKTTQARLLAGLAQERGWRVEVLHFPAYDTPSGRRIAAYLAGEESLDPREVMELFARNRREKLSDLQAALEEADIVILDRYAPSGWAYGMARGFPLAWLKSLDAGLPVPDLVVVLDVPVEVARRRLGPRGRKDSYERDGPFLERVREAYLLLARENGWTVVPDDRPPEEVNAELCRLLTARGFLAVPGPLPEAAGRDRR